MCQPRNAFVTPRTIRRILFILLTALTALCAGFGPPRLTDRDVAPNYRLSPAQLQEAANVRTPPPISAEALLVYDVDADQVLFERSAQEALRPASLTKLMTALLVLEEADLATVVTISTQDLVDGATMGLQAGEQLTVEQLLWGLLIPSGNDAAMALARHSSGSVDAFVERMNRRAAELGLSATTFRNPHGFDADDHLSSAADLLQLVRLNWNYPLFRTIVGTAETTVAGHPLQNTNQLLGVFAGANGVKTGTTPLAGQCLIARIERNGHAVLIVLLGSGDRYTDVRNLFDFYTQNFAWIDAGAMLSTMNRLYDDEGKLWYIRPQGAFVDALAPRLQAASLQAVRTIHNRSALIWRPGAVVGSLAWYLNGERISEQPLILR